jgi:hypothetical protein
MASVGNKPPRCHAAMTMARTSVGSTFRQVWEEMQGDNDDG